MRPVVYVNGIIKNAGEAVVPVYDHGFLYGEGVYETLRTYNGEPFLFDRHMRRLHSSAALMKLSVPVSDAEMLARVRETMREAAAPGPGSVETIGVPEAYIRILLTRGVGELTYNLAATPVPTLVIIVKPYVAMADRTFADGIVVSVVSIRRNHKMALNPMIKSNNLLNNALAMQQALARGGEEALMQNLASDVVECSQSNVFLVKQGALTTPPLEAGLLPGITREFVLEIAADLDIPAREARVTPADVLSADEMFLTGTTREVTPVVRVDEQVIGSGAPGPVTRRLLQELRARAQTLTRSAVSSAASPATSA